MELLAARIVTTLNYCEPYTPTSKSKIERRFRTLKNQWMAALDMRGFFSEPEQIRRLSQEQIDRCFLLEVERRVSADSVVVIDHTEYEVDYRFAKQRIRLRYSTDMKEVYIVENDGTLTPVKLLNKQENALIKREKVYLYRGEG